MNTVLLNLPFKKRVVRRWVASYYAPNFLMPPLELMSLGAIVKEWKKEPVSLIDAVAENWDRSRVIDELKRLEPDLLVTIPGFNIFPQDMETLDEISNSLPGTKTICFGYLPTQFPEEILKRTRVDIIIKNEPELTFSELFDCLQKGGDLSRIQGIAYRKDNTVIVNEDRERIRNLDLLPFPDHSLINLKHYSESFLGRPIGLILSERGCPYQCTYCVRTYGQKLVSRSSENVLQEIASLTRQGIRNIRFLDDTFTLNQSRLKEICQGLIDRNLGIKWTCLTRFDSLERGALELMKKSGCQRIYIGIESGSQKILNYYRKNLDLDLIKKLILLIKESGIETSAFFIVGAPPETEADFRSSIQFARDLDLDYIIVTKLQFWPGTEIFQMEKEKLRFDLFAPGELRYEIKGYDRAKDWQKIFYRDFYLREKYIRKKLGALFRSPRDILSGFFKLIKYLLIRDDWDDFI